MGAYDGRGVENDGLREVTKCQKYKKCVQRTRRWIEIDVYGNFAGTKNEMREYTFKQGLEILVVFKSFAKCISEMYKATIVAIVLHCSGTGNHWSGSSNRF